MRSFLISITGAMLAGVLLATAAEAAGRLEISQAWIRAAAPGAMMRAGYATLHNAGDAPLTIVGADSTDFGDVSLHETVEENGVERMHPLGRLVIAPGASVVFAPGGRHFMLMRPQRELRSGDAAQIHIATDSGAGAMATFVVRDAEP